MRRRSHLRRRGIRVVRAKRGWGEGRTRVELMTELVVLGGSGQVGQALAREARARGIAHVAFGRAACDIADAGGVERAIVGARLVVNCAAYTAVDRAEAEEELAHEVNAIGAGNVARKCADAAIPLVHISTDYVFDG